MSIAVTLWWLSFWTALGLCVGSFLNAVIYRLPRHGSLRVPRWSACPHCGHRIAWFDNFPILSFVLLRGRCRGCGRPIATRYVVIEAAMALLVLLLLDAFFIAHTRSGLSRSPFGLTDDLTYDWPIFLAHVSLFACLLCMSAIDLEHYWVDIRFTNLATIVGFVLHTLWTPTHGKAWLRPGDTTAFVCVSAMVGLALAWAILICQPHEADEPEADRNPIAPDSAAPLSGLVQEPALFLQESTVLKKEQAIEPGIAQAIAPRESDPPASTDAVPSRFLGWAACLLLVALFVCLFYTARGQEVVSSLARELLPLGLFFVLILRESTVHRTSDDEIMAAIEEERPSARRMAAKELLLLLPAILFAVAGLLIMTYFDEIAVRIRAILHTSVPIHGWGLFRNWSPLTGFATAAAGYIVAGALGWTVRIVFTFLFGKEAFGTGDIHLMAAARCVAGWPVVVLGFFLATALALLGWVLALPFKRPRAIPLGPWLSLGFLSVVILLDRVLVWPIVVNFISLARSLFLPGGSM